MEQTNVLQAPDPPSEAQVGAILGPVKALWDELRTFVAKECAPIDEEWNRYSKKVNWRLRLKRKQRAIVYLSPAPGAFMASFALGDKAVEAARASALPAAVVTDLDNARRYAEGRPCRITVTAPSDLEVVKTLVRIKRDN